MLAVCAWTKGAANASEAATRQQGDRQRVSLNENWRFLPQGIAFGQRPALLTDGWEVVSLPHTWNASDPFDDFENYRRGESWYRRDLFLTKELRDKRLYLHFEGINQLATIYVNGSFAGRHEGGYTAFTIEITDLVTFDKNTAFGSGSTPGRNILAVQVSNAHDPEIIPLSVGYALYGGIYRDVWLIATDAVHFDLSDHGSRGVYINTPSVSELAGTIRVRARVANDSATARTAAISHQVLDREGELVSEVSESLQIDAGEIASSELLLTVEKPALWSPGDPRLYEVRSRLYVGDRAADEVRNPLGFRWFNFDPETGFSLNGRKLQLLGTNRHQDREGLGSALTDALHVRDLQWIKEMGANFLRLAHYPQDPAVLHAADSLGLLVWEEIPLVNYVSGAAGLAAKTENTLREMIRQHYNHPSVIIWGSMNETLLWKDGHRRREFDLNDDGSGNDATYLESIRRLAERLKNVIRREDPTRVSAMAIHSSDVYDKTGLDREADVLGMNLYNGWYGGEFEGFGRGLDRRHERKPGQVIFVSEYGAGSDQRINSLTPMRFDYSGQWARMFHESHLRQINERPYLAGTAIWNQFDFSQPHTGGTISHLNQKGMQRWDRSPKDVYYLYKANWNQEPMVYIASRDWPLRSIEWSREGTIEPQPLDVYTNLDSVTLAINGRVLGSRTPNDLNKASWKVVLSPGKNVIEAVGLYDGVRHADRMTVEAVPVPANLSELQPSFSGLWVNVGSQAQFVDEADRIWVEDRPYRKDGFGFVGGEPKAFYRHDIILGTREPGLMFSYRSGCKSYRFDVPDGKYRVELRLAEPEWAKPGARVIDIEANGRVIYEGLDLAKRYGPMQSAKLRFDVTAKNRGGIVIVFHGRQGHSVLSAISLQPT